MMSLAESIHWGATILQTIEFHPNLKNTSLTQVILAYLKHQENIVALHQLFFYYCTNKHHGHRRHQVNRLSHSLCFKFHW